MTIKSVEHLLECIKMIEADKKLLEKALKEAERIDSINVKYHDTAWTGCSDNSFTVTVFESSGKYYDRIYKEMKKVYIANVCSEIKIANERLTRLKNLKENIDKQLLKEELPDVA